MLTKKMDPPATLHQPSFHEEDEGYAILDRMISFNNVREVGGREVGDAVPEFAARPNPSIADLSVTVPKAAAANEEGPSSPSEAFKPNAELYDYKTYNPFLIGSPTLDHIYKLLFQTSYPRWLMTTMGVV